MARNGDTRVAPARAMSLREAGWRKAPGARLQDCAGRGDAAGPDRRRAVGRAARRRCRRLRHTAPRARRTATGKRPYGRPATAQRRPREQRNDYGEQRTAADRQLTMPAAAATATPSGGRGSQWLRPCAGAMEKTVASVAQTRAGLYQAVSATAATPAATTTDTTNRQKRSDHRPRQRDRRHLRTDRESERKTRSHGFRRPAKPAGTSESATYTPMRPKESADLRIFTRTCVWRNLSKPTTVVRLGRTYREGPT